MDFASIFSLALKYGPLIANVWSEATSNDEIVTKLKAEAAPVANLLENLGSQLFPKADKALHIVGGLVASFDPNYVMWIQKALNQLMGANLVVDGKYGSLTTAAVELIQKKYGLVIDGIVGTKTDGLLGALLAGLNFVIPKPATP